MNTGCFKTGSDRNPLRIPWDESGLFTDPSEWLKFTDFM